MPELSSLITIDFWDTLVDPKEGGETRSRIRHQALCEIAWRHIEDLPEHDIEAAVQHASDSFNRIWLNDHRTPLTEELVNTILEHIGIPATEQESTYLVRQFEQSLWEGPPALATDAATVIDKLSEKHNLALVSDTMFSPGRVLREFLSRQQLLDYFDDFVFSDETGYSKPNPKAFESVLAKTGSNAKESYHIGDRLDTDVKGAKGVGMNAILFTGISDRSGVDDIDIAPDHVCTSWQEIAELLT